MKRWMQIVALTTTFAMPLPMLWADAAEDREVQRQIETFDGYLLLGNGPQAMQTFMALKSKFPNHVLVKAYEGKILMLQNNAQGAQTALSDALKIEPHHAIASALMANLEFRTFKVEEARKRVDEALAKHPESPELMQISAEMYMAQQKQDEAEKIWVKLLEQKDLPKSVAQVAHTQYGTILAGKGEHAKAAEHLKQALEVSWHVAVAVNYVQQLDQAGAPQATIKQAIADLRSRLDAARSHPQYAQIKQQVDQQIAPIEAKLKSSEVDDSLNALAAKLDASDAKNKFVTHASDIRSLRATINRVTTDETLKQQQLTKLRILEVVNYRRLLEDGLEKNRVATWRKSTAGTLLKLAQGLDDAKVVEAVAYANTLLEAAEKELQAETGKVMALAQAGWMFNDFLNPNSDQLKTLKDQGLPVSYRSFSQEMRDALKTHYEALAAKRVSPEVEATIKAYIESPTDQAHRSKVITQMQAHIKGLKLEDESVTSFSVIPARVWVEQLSHGRKMDFSSQADQTRERSYSIWSDVESYQLKKNGNWARLVEDLERVEKLYPRWQAIYGRVFPRIYMEQYQAAHDDVLVALAVFCWERANTQGLQTSENDKDWTRQGLAMVKVLDELARNKPTTRGSHPSAPLKQFVASLKAGQFTADVDYLIQKHDEHTMDAALMKEVASGQMRLPVLDALARAYVAAKGDRKEQIKTAAGRFYDYSSPAWCVIRAQEEKDPEQRLARWRTVVSYEPMNVQGNLEIGKALEKEGKKVDAMLAYNVAANGQDAAKLTGLAREAALARDRLEGPTPDLNSLAKVYESVAGEMYKQVNANTNNRSQAAILFAIANRIAGKNGNAVWVLGRRADSARNLDEFDRVIADTEQLLKLQPDNAGLYNAILGNAYREKAQLAKAMDYYNKAIALDYKTPLVYLRLGNLYKASGEYDKAVEQYTNALQMDPEYVSALIQRSEIYEYIFDRDDDALNDANQALEINKKKNPEGNFFSLEFRISNLRMKIAQRNLNKAFGVSD